MSHDCGSRHTHLTRKLARRRRSVPFNGVIEDEHSNLQRGPVTYLRVVACDGAVEVDEHPYKDGALSRIGDMAHFLDPSTVFPRQRSS